MRTRKHSDELSTPLRRIVNLEFNPRSVQCGVLITRSLEQDVHRNEIAAQLEAGLPMTLGVFFL